MASPPQSSPDISVVVPVFDEEGAVGLVLTRPTKNTVQEIWQLIEGPPNECQQPILLGGPVPGPLLALHTDAELAESEVISGVYVSSNKDALNSILSHDDRPFRIFSGYSGWGGGQLEGELQAGGWLTTPASVEHVFADLDDLWERVVRQIGLEILAPPGKFRHIPSDPSVN